MAWIIAIVVGGIIGLMYGIGIAPERRFYVLINFVIGALGGMLGIWFFFMVLGIASASATVDVALAVIWSIIGAMVLMAVIDAINYAVYKSRRRSEYGRTREESGYAHEYDVEEEHKVKKRKK